MNTQHTENENVGTTHGGSRPMKVFVDSQGSEWICDNTVDPSGSFDSQGCWRTDQMPFDRNF